MYKSSHLSHLAGWTGFLSVQLYPRYNRYYHHFSRTPALRIQVQQHLTQFTGRFTDHPAPFLLFLFWIGFEYMEIEIDDFIDRAEGDSAAVAEALTREEESAFLLRGCFDLAGQPGFAAA